MTHLLCYPAMLHVLYTTISDYTLAPSLLVPNSNRFAPFSFMLDDVFPTLAMPTTPPCVCPLLYLLHAMPLPGTCPSPLTWATDLHAVYYVPFRNYHSTSVAARRRHHACVEGPVWHKNAGASYRILPMDGGHAFRAI